MGALGGDQSLYTELGVKQSLFNLTECPRK